MSHAAALTNWSAGTPKTILLATDRSVRCDRPLDRAVQLAQTWQATLVVLHVIERHMSGSEAEAVAAKIKRELFGEIPSRSIRFQIDVRFGSVSETVLATAGDVGADLIVTGVARYNELGDYVLGTTVDRLVRTSPVPVLVVKGRPRTDYAKLLLPTDYSDCSAKALEVLPAFSRADATLMHAYHVPYEGFISREANEAEFREMDAEACAAFVERLAPALKARFSVSNQYGETCQVLTRAVHDIGFDLAVIGSHGRGGLGRALIGSTAEALLGCLPCDVLIVPVA